MGKDKKETDKTDDTQPQVEGRERLQEMLKRLSPSSNDSVAISDIPDHCAKVMALALNLEWFGHSGKAPRVPEGAELPAKRNAIVVRVEKLDMTLSAFVAKIREIIHRIS